MCIRDSSLIKQYYPNIVIVGNKKTFEMIEGYYGVGGERYVVGSHLNTAGSLSVQRHKWDW